MDMNLGISLGLGINMFIVLSIPQHITPCLCSQLVHVAPTPHLHSSCVLLSSSISMTCVCSHLLVNLLCILLAHYPSSIVQFTTHSMIELCLSPYT